ncbi:MAG: restriction endonuclease [Rhodococcus erythropolis]|nr:restriction endonuclease [Rhodococcus erythropolis]
MKFRGLAAPEVQDSSINDDLRKVWKELQGAKFENYVARFTVLNCTSVSRTWIDAVTDGAKPLNAPACPDPWREWVVNRTYPALMT